MPWNDGLTGVAHAIAAINHTPLRVMAGPGTGKSFAMKRRIQRLLEEGCDGSRILAVTFTRNAAASLVDDLRGIGVRGCLDLRCETLHAFCFRLLSEQAVFEYLGRVARPLVTFSKSGVLQFEAKPMLRDLCGDGSFGGMRECTSRIRAFEAAWARLQNDTPGWALNPVDAQFQVALVSWLRFHRAMLIGELVPEALRYLRNNPTAEVLRAFDHVVVDEYQDLNKAEQTLIDLLAANGNQAIVGDVDQSIYSFRHAHPAGIVEFNAAHAGTRDEVLDGCRRCPKRVVAMADSLIRHNHPGVAAPRLRPKDDNPEGEVHVVQWNSLSEEANGLAAYVRHLIQEDGFAPEDILILSPRRLIGYGIRDRIAAAGIAVHSFYHDEALEDETAQEALCLLTLKANPDDYPALRWWLGYGSNSWNAGQYAKLRRLAEETGIAPQVLLAEMLAGGRPQTGMRKLVVRWKELQARLGTISALDVRGLIDALLPDGNDGTRVLREAAELAIDECEDAEDLLDYLRAVATRPEMPEDGAFVRVMSLHKSKGLTAKVCIVAGCMQGLIPFVDRDAPAAQQAETLQEQRRLFYVAITRCTQVLALSSVARITPELAYKMGALIGQNGNTVASSFMHELGPQCPAAQRGPDWLASRLAVATA